MIRKPLLRYTLPKIFSVYGKMNPLKTHKVFFTGFAAMAAVKKTIKNKTKHDDTKQPKKQTKQKSKQKQK